MSAKVKTQRTSYKRSIERVSKAVIAFSNETLLSDLEANLDILNEYWTLFQSAQMKIEESTKEENMDVEVLEMVETEATFLATKSTLKNLCKRYYDADGRQQQGGGNANQQLSNAKLPKLETPKFDGAFNNWITYRDLFNSMINNQAGLTNSQKLQYLVSGVSNEAADIISEYKITDENFAVAWKALEDRYENERLLIKVHLSILFEQPILESESAVSLRLLLRTTQKCLRSLKSLGGPTEHWDWMLVYLIVSRLDSKTRRYWELRHTEKVMPTWQQLVTALETRCDALEAEGSNTAVIPGKSNNKSIRNVSPTIKKKSSTDNSANHSSHTKAFHTSIPRSSCAICSGDHDCSECKEFLSKNHDGRTELANKYLLCYKCLKPNHNFRYCKASKCQKCEKRHHSLLHNPNSNSPKVEATNKEKPIVKLGLHMSTKRIHSPLVLNPVLLSTALIKVRNNNGSWELVRALLDSASESSIILDSCVQRLKLKRTSCHADVHGIGGLPADKIRGGIQVEVMSRLDPLFKISVSSVIMTKIASDLPNKVIDISNWNYIENLPLADPNFNEPGNIELLIGGDYFLSLLSDGNKSQIGLPTAQNTVFGWIIGGMITSAKDSKIASFTTQVSLDKVLKTFWEIEEIPKLVTKSVEDDKCELHFENTYQRNNEGRFVVRLPFNEKKLCFGKSRSMAMCRFMLLERRFAKDEKFRQDYIGVMKELLALNHMKLASKENGAENDNYYLPHHAVIKPNKMTTKIRVVYDAGAKSSNGVSLNDRLRVGPRLQQDLLQILLRFRSFKIVVSADIEKMFRQILINEDDQRYQRILWRESPEESIKDYELTTVTFGTASAGFLAVKSLQKLAQVEGKNYPEVQLVINEDFYMDDLFTGGDNPVEVIELVKNLNEIVSRGKFVLRKWITNNASVLNSIEEKFRAFENIWDLPATEDWKALGLSWHPGSDKFGYKVNLCSENGTITKRSILATIGRLYDPLGLLAPTIVVGKILMQSLWAAEVTWDEQLSAEIRDQWLHFQEDLSEFENIQIPRWLGSFSSEILELHGFCDASMVAYSAVIYSRTKDANGRYHTNIVVAKSKVAPLKTISLPKLELSSALLLTRLFKVVCDSLRVETVNVLWSDSTIVLYWLRKSPHTLNTFVANRISEIQTTDLSLNWRHVDTTENPADCASRGISALQLKDHKLWWTGPEWLREEELKWPNSTPPMSSDTKKDAEREMKNKFIVSLVVTGNEQMKKLCQKFSSIDKLKRVTAYIFRFIENARGKGQRIPGELTVIELENALKFWIVYAQQEMFTATLKRMRKGKSLRKSDPLLSLNPFLENDELVRVGGRLVEAALNEEQKHPIILPRSHSITRLIVADIHSKTLHGGAQLMLSCFRRKYWLVAARRLFRQVVQNCVKCCRVGGKTCNQIMGNLPASRIVPSRPFEKSCVDYAGPLKLKVPTINKRTQTPSKRWYDVVKGYIAVFVCSVTKAIHLEVVSSMDTESFLAAYRRFVSRRGKCREMRSDNGSNFIGAKRELADLSQLLKNQFHNDVVSKCLADDGTDWHMNPPHAPHFGGLFEAGVKSVKFHLRRLLSTTPYTFEELTTVLSQIEAILNSRPITPISDDVNDMEALTPGHFLVGHPLNAVPEPSLERLKLNSLSRYQLIQRTVQDFWRRWELDYLSSLQQRVKWKLPVESLRIGQMVTIKEDDMPPTKWLLARILEVYPGKDSNVRVAKLQTATGELSKSEIEKLKLKGVEFKRSGVVKLKTIGGILERPVHKLCVLPIEVDEEKD